MSATRPLAIAARSQADIDQAVRTVIAERLPLFAAGFLIPMVVWALTIIAVHADETAITVATLVFHAVALGVALAMSRRDATHANVERIVGGTTLVLAITSIALFVRAGSTGEVLGFVLFTLCAMAALLFPWGWARELLLTASVLAVYACAFPSLRFALGPVELTPVVAIAAALCVAIAEGNTRSFRAGLVRRWGEEAALRELAASRDTYRDITENARDFIWASDLDGRLTYINEGGARILGCTPSELIGRNIDQFITDHPTNATPTAMRSLLGAGGALPPTVLEWRAVSGPIWLEVLAYAVRDPAGTVIGFRGISRDVTGRTLAADALRESEARYRGLVESQEALIYRADQQGNLTFLNEACRRKYGVEDVPLAQLNFLGFVHPDDATLAQAALTTVLGGRRYQRTSRGRTPDGWRWIEWEVCAIPDAAGTVTEIQGVGRDVTEQHAADDALQHTLAALREREEQLRLMGLRQAAVREDERKRLGLDLHDGVCQELVGISILIESARQRGVSAMSDATLTRAQTYLRTVGEHLRLLACGLRPLQLADLGLGECLRTLAAATTVNGRMIVVTVPDDIPRLGEDTEVAVYRVAQEALANAVRHAAAEHVSLTLGTSGGALVLEVRDDGCGFERAELPTAALGVVAMEERATALGGTLRVQSAPGTGTTVRLHCPLGKASNQGARASA
ncbi:MAG: PAS domain S-box protein [Candidatus Binatia bacterium]